jgi:chromate transport protein ChrA
MYLHALLIGMVGLIALVVLEMFEGYCTRHVWVGIILGVIAATVLTAVGGIWDTRVPGAEVAM